MHYSNKFVRIETHANGSVHISFTGYDPNETEFDQYLEACKRILQEESPAFVQIFDARFIKTLRADLRLKQSKWIEKNRELISNRIKHAIFIIPSMFLRIVLNCIFAFSKPPYPYTVVATLEEAIELAEAKKL